MRLCATCPKVLPGYEKDLVADAIRVLSTYRPELLVKESVRDD